MTVSLSRVDDGNVDKDLTTPSRAPSIATTTESPTANPLDPFVSLWILSVSRLGGSDFFDDPD